jgi:alpha-galactosidase/6-phospho-beta-glucosidase family protein
MKTVFVGGGSLRLLPILRAVFDTPEIYADGEISLVDLDIKKAEMVGKMIMKCPEYQKVKCKVTWTTDLDSALEGADILYVTMAIGSPYNYRRASRVCHELGFLASDQMSPTGAYYSLTGGKIIMNFARKMEKHCPNAMMLIFANPVAVYSAMVNNHTKIKALGVCGGFGNHRWDLSRLMGKDEYRTDYDVEVAGLNHLSFILEGTCREGDLYETLGRYLTPDWKMPEIRHVSYIKQLKFALEKLIWMYHRFGKVIFSTEGDGFSHFFYEDSWNNSGYQPESDEVYRQQVEKAKSEADERYRLFGSHVDKELDSEFWNSDVIDKPLFGKCPRDIAVPILKALAGLGEEKIAASAPNNGAVNGFTDRTALEYSMFIDENGFRAAGNYTLPETFHSVIAPIADHQTLLGDASATLDPKVFADAMYAYPVQQNTKNARELNLKLLDIFAEDIPEEFQASKVYFQD